MAVLFGYAKNSWPSGEGYWPDSPAPGSGGFLCQIAFAPTGTKSVGMQFESEGTKGRFRSQIFVSLYENRSFYSQSFFDATFSTTRYDYCKSPWPSLAWPYSSIASQKFKVQSKHAITAPQSIGTQISLSQDVKQPLSLQADMVLTYPSNLATSAYIPLRFEVTNARRPLGMQWRFANTKVIATQIRWRPF